MPGTPSGENHSRPATRAGGNAGPCCRVRRTAVHAVLERRTGHAQAQVAEAQVEQRLVVEPRPGGLPPCRRCHPGLALQDRASLRTRRPPVWHRQPGGHVLEQVEAASADRGPTGCRRARSAPAVHGQRTVECGLAARSMAERIRLGHVPAVATALQTLRSPARRRPSPDGAGTAALRGPTSLPRRSPASSGARPTGPGRAHRACPQALRRSPRNAPTSSAASTARVQHQRRLMCRARHSTASATVAAGSGTAKRGDAETRGRPAGRRSLDRGPGPWAVPHW